MPSAYSVAGNAAYTKALPTFLSLFMFGMFYQLILVWDALRLKNTIQIIGLCLYNLGLLIYAVVQIDQINKATDGLEGYLYNGEIWTLLKPSLIIIPLVLGLGTIAMSLVAWRLYGEFAWTIYKHISADVRMKRRYLTFQVRASTARAEDSLTGLIDLHRAPQIRLLFLPGLHSPVSCERGQSTRCRIRSHRCRYPHHDRHFVHGSALYPTRKQRWHGRYYRTLSVIYLESWK
jgi:hypothetical protein